VHLNECKKNEKFFLVLMKNNFMSEYFLKLNFEFLKT
jgi:hypothetical protein